MKYEVWAKFLGSYVPDKRAKIGNCIILKSYDQYYLEDDRPNIPVRNKSFEFHSLEKGVKNYIYYPQKPISIRTFESEYLITTEVETYSVSEAFSIASERFINVVCSLSLVAKNKTVRLNKRRIKRGDETYDFEILAVFFKRNKELIRVKLPSPLVNGRNFFPKKFPKGFLSQSKKYLKSRDQLFQKGLIYFQRATAMRYSGVFSELEIILNFVKCIELICWTVGDEDRLGLKKKDFEELGTKKVIELVGKKIGVIEKTRKEAKKLWDARNKGDVAHKHLYFNPYSPRSTNAIINFDIAEATTAEFLRSYYKYREINPKWNFS